MRYVPNVGNECVALAFSIRQLFAVVDGVPITIVKTKHNSSNVVGFNLLVERPQVGNSGSEFRTTGKGSVRSKVRASNNVCKIDGIRGTKNWATGFPTSAVTTDNSARERLGISASLTTGSEQVWFSPLVGGNVPGSHARIEGNAGNLV